MLRYRFVCLVICLSVLLMLFSGSAAAEFVRYDKDEGYIHTIFEDDFDTGYSIGQGLDPSKWASSTAALIANSPDGDSSRGNVAACRNYTTVRMLPLITEEDAEYLKQIKISFDIRFNNSAVSRYMSVFNSSGAFSYSLQFGSDGMIKVYNDVNTSSANISATSSYNVDTWYSVTLYYNFVLARYSGLITDGINTYTFTDKIITTSNGLTTKPEAAYYFGITTGNTANNEVYLDNVKYSARDFRFVSALPKNGFDDFGVWDSKVVLEFSNPLKESSIENINVMSSDDDAPVFAASVDEGVLLLIFEENLKFNTEYILEFSEIKDIYGLALRGEKYLTFKTMQEGLASDIPTINLSERKASASVKNLTSTPQNAVLALVLYNENNSLAGLYKTEKTVVSGAKAEFEVMSDIEFTRASAFMFDDFTNLNMFREEFASYAMTEAVLSIGDSEVQIQKFDLETDSQDWIYIKGNVIPASKKTVLIGVQGENGNQSMLVPVVSDLNGLFEFKYLLGSNDECGLYTLNIGGRRITNSPNASLYYLNESMRNAIIKGINDATSISNTENYILGVKDTLIQANSVLNEEYFNNNAYSVLFEQKPFSDWDEIISAFIRSKDILNALNKADWLSLPKIMSDNEDVIMHSIESQYNEFLKLSSTVRGKIMKSVKDCGNVTDILEFRSIFLNELEKNKYDSVTSDRNNVSRGFSSVIIEKTPSELPSPPLTESATPILQISNHFSDLAGYEWALDSISALYNNGIVSGDGSGLFRPADSITREEFVKMLTTAVNILDYDEETAFNDVEPGKWYSPYIARATKFGLIRGVSESVFGVGMSITRQDTAVIIHRVGVLNPFVLESENGPDIFTDANDIADYAVEAVMSLCTTGIIKGMGDGRFAPLESLNRAQASVVICRFMQNINGT